MGRPPNPLAERFAQLVVDIRAELAGLADTDQRAALLRGGVMPAAATGNRWARDRVTGLQQVADLTGYAFNSVRAFRATSRKEHAARTATARTMPPEDTGPAGEGRGWVIWRLAVWMATRDEGRARVYPPALVAHVRQMLGTDPDMRDTQIAAQAGVSVQRARILAAMNGVLRNPEDVMLLPLVREMVNAAGSAPTGAHIRDMLAGEGHRVSVDRAALLLAAVGSPPAQPSRWPGHEHYMPAVTRLLAEHDGNVPVTAAGHALGVTRKLAAQLLREAGAPGFVTDAEVLPLLRDLAASTATRRLLLTDVAAVLDDAGLHVCEPRVRRLYRAAGGMLPHLEPSDGPAPGPLESMRADGLVTPAQLARAYEVTDGAVWKARVEDRITPALWEDGRPLYDASKITYRRDYRPGPVDVGHEMAAEPVPTSNEEN